MNRRSFFAAALACLVAGPKALARMVRGKPKDEWVTVGFRGSTKVQGLRMYLCNKDGLYEKVGDSDPRLISCDFDLSGIPDNAEITQAMWKQGDYCCIDVTEQVRHHVRES